MRRVYAIIAASLALATFATLPTRALAQGFTLTAAGSSGISAPIACDKSALIQVGAASTVQLVGAVSGQSIYVCGFSFTTAGTSPTVAFEYGTGTTCGTGTTSLMLGQPLPSGVMSYGNGFGTIFRTPVNQALCLVLTGTSPVANGVLTYAQF